MPGLARKLEPLAFALPAGLLACAAVLGAYLTDPLVPLAVLLALGAAALCVARPFAGVLLAIALVPLELFALPLGGTTSVSPAEGTFALSGLAWGARRIAEESPPWVRSPLGKPLGLLVLSLVPGFLVALDVFPVVKTLIMWTCFLLVYQLIVDDGRVETVRRVLLALTLAGAVVGVIALIGTAGGEELKLVGSGSTATGRAVGSFSSPNTLATFLALSLPGALALGLRGPMAARPLALGSFLLAFAALALSLSRGGLLAALGALGSMLAWRPVRALALGGMLVVVGLSASGVVSLGDTQRVDIVTKRLSTVGTSAERGIDPRFQVWRRTPEIIADNPVIGVGVNQFSLVGPRYGLIDSLEGIPFEHAHNIFLTVAAELGILGVLALVWLAAQTVRLLVRACRRRPVPERGLAFALAASLLALGLQGLVDFTLRSNVITALVAVLLACVVVLARTAPSGEAAREGSDRQRPAAPFPRARWPEPPSRAH